jgi:exopolysaccharide/PEP-CTERM locus tyrosine autokinase
LVEKTLRKMQDAVARAPDPAVATRAHIEVAPKSGDTAAHRVLPAPPLPTRQVHFDAAALRAVGLLPPVHEERQIAQQYRQIKRPLIANAMGRGTPRMPDGHLIMVASAVPGEGKTFTAINLALSMSMEKDVHVLLVDADVAKPHISRLLGAADAPGLLDLLRDPRLDVRSAVLGSNIPNLSFLPAGAATSEATELLASTRMYEVLQAIVQHDQQRVVLFDSPPLLHTTESRALAQVAGQVVVVVRAGETPQQVLLDALSYLREHRSVSFVLNQSMQSAPEGYYYGYGEGRTGLSDK